MKNIKRILSAIPWYLYLLPLVAVAYYFFPRNVKKLPTVGSRITKDQARQKANQVKEAIGHWNDDEDTIIRIFAGLNRADYNSVYNAFGSFTNITLDTVFEDLVNANLTHALDKVLSAKEKRQFIIRNPELRDLFDDLPDYVLNEAAPSSVDLVGIIAKKDEPDYSKMPVLSKPLTDWQKADIEKRRKIVHDQKLNEILNSRKDEGEWVKRGPGYVFVPNPVNVKLGRPQPKKTPFTLQKK